MSVAAINPKRWIQIPLLLSIVGILSGAAGAPPAVKPSSLGLILFAVALLIGVPLAYRLWRETHQEEDPTRDSEMLSDFEQAYAEGKMDEAEFRRIRDLLIGAKVGTGGKGRTKPRRDEQDRLPRTAQDPPAPAPTDVTLPPPDSH